MALLVPGLVYAQGPGARSNDRGPAAAAPGLLTPDFLRSGGRGDIARFGARPSEGLGVLPDLSLRRAAPLLSGFLAASVAPVEIPAESLAENPAESPAESPAAAAPAAVEALATAGPAELRRTGFLSQQLRHRRVRRAHTTRAAEVEALFLAQGVVHPSEIFFRAYKREQLLEVWALDAGASSYVLINTYAICGTSGKLGPKRRQGDEQIPEGFYHIDLFNPVSNFHLSLRLDYPNAVDRARGVAGDLGGDIFIHGGCATIGCLPVTDRGIEEVYLMAIRARDAGQTRIPVHVFPTRLDDDGMAWLGETFGTDHPDYAFWQSLEPGHLAFETTRTVPVMAQADGQYTFAMDVPGHPGHYVFGTAEPVLYVPAPLPQATVLSLQHTIGLAQQLAGQEEEALPRIGLALTMVTGVRAMTVPSLARMLATDGERPDAPAPALAHASGAMLLELREEIGLTAEQVRRIEAIQARVDQEIQALLTVEQRTRVGTLDPSSMD